MAKRSARRGVNNRYFYLLGALVVAAMFAAALYVQYVMREDPCPLCMVQRVIFIIIGGLFLLAALQNPARLGSKIYSGFISLFALAGIATASRHIWLQHLPKDQVPACGPGIDYMLKHFPMAEVWQEVLHGSGECATKGWAILGLGLPELSLIGYVVLGAWALFIAGRRG